jgi:hypothetical protein
LKHLEELEEAGRDGKGYAEELVIVEALKAKKVRS